MKLRSDIKSVHYLGPKVKQSTLNRKIVTFTDGSTVILSANAKEEQWKYFNKVSYVHENKILFYSVDEDRYKISSWGRVFDTKKNRFLKIGYKNGGGYKIIDGEYVYNFGHGRVSLHTDWGREAPYVHRLVIDNFGDGNKQQKICVDHIDTDPRNNCIENLRYVTYKENTNNPLTKYNMQKGKQKKSKTKSII